MVVAPKFSPLSLPELAEGTLDLLRARAVIEAARFESVSFDGVDLTDAVLSACSLDRVSIADSQLRGIRVSETEIAGLNAPVLAAARSEWRDATITESRIGSAELFESDLSGVRIEGSKLGYLNLRAATLVNVLVTGCTIDEVDLGGANLRMVAFVDCQIGTFTTTRSTLKDVDLRGSSFAMLVGIDGLRGATIDEGQLAEFAPHLAAAAGIELE